MKIIVLSSCYPSKSSPNRGIFIHKTLKALTELGVEVHVLQPSNWFPPVGLHKLHIYWKRGYEQSKDTLNELDGIKIHNPKVFVKMPSRLFKEDAWEREGKSIAKYLRNSKELKDVQLIFAQFLIHEGYVGTIIKSATGLPLISIALGDDVHAWPENNPSLIPLIQKVLIESDLVLANGRKLAADCTKFERREVLPIYRGVDLKTFKPVPAGQKKYYKQKFGLSPAYKFLVCIATPVKLKGWLELFDAISSIKSGFNDWRLIAVAPPRKNPDAIDLLAEAKSRRIEHLIDFMGAIPHEDIPDLLRASEAFILPSYNEGLSNAVLEALATGLAVIATDVGGHSEVIKHNESGILIRPKDIMSLRKALTDIINNEILREKIASNARNEAVIVGSYEKNAKKMIQLFESRIVNQRAQPI